MITSGGSLDVPVSSILVPFRTIDAAEHRRCFGRNDSSQYDVRQAQETQCAGGSLSKMDSGQYDVRREQETQRA